MRCNVSYRSLCQRALLLGTSRFMPCDRPAYSKNTLKTTNQCLMKYIEFVVRAQGDCGVEQTETPGDHDLSASGQDSLNLV